MNIPIGTWFESNLWRECCCSKMDMRYSRTQSATCVANIDSRSAWRTEKWRSQGIYWIQVAARAGLFSVAYEQCQAGPAESSIDSIMILNRTQMVESGLLDGFWYRALVNAKDARNVTDHDRIKTTPYYFMHGEPKNLSKFRAFGCRACQYLNEDCREEASTYLEW